MRKIGIKKIILFVLFLGALTGAGITTYLYSKLSKTLIKNNLTEKSTLLSAPNSNEVTNDKHTNILLLGYGGAGHDGGLLTDSLIVVNIDRENSKVNLISVPRDLWVAILTDWDSTTNNKINEAYSIGGNEIKYANKKPEFRGDIGRGNLAKYVVGSVVGMPINYFIAVDFSGFSKAIDLLGGIPVDVPKTFDDYFYPVKGLENETCGKSAQEIADLHSKFLGFDLEKQFTCRYEHLHFDKGIQTINGEKALKFVRSRHSNESGGDFARSQRQFALLTGIKNKIISLQIITKADPVFDKLVESVKTDMDANGIKALVNILVNSNSYTTKEVFLTDQNVLQQSKSNTGQFILVPKEGVNKWTQVQNYITSEIK
ncbi:hypothetical protein A2W13_03180 [Candidatus Woesebacteria bacterium RBG_16_36_11]|uniref:Cell envelope-related transcriptional attenuator domain-containing protein n=3 Tax=Candidatus Woeseibacteriota TaxID=1752722 RepID=A0A1F7XBR6_9BACT|nr:MAG: hypothetical protein A2Z67_00260 [Candidatus Woesebacteria bacterium RBG_13_36_22]OGM12461.1 MAG: hypothetical protein A2W13_03180 [Candidatus Woesebacteria bacterium RBG_16_36_11]OGM15640.1 MAG: hypothetical protein A2V55_02085 [Candidatus Woesebacteria bacterium RBG_19FT_COMBO_37_29]